METLCSGKIHRVTVTEVNLISEGSITIYKALMLAANMLPYEQVRTRA